MWQICAFLVHINTENTIALSLKKRKEQFAFTLSPRKIQLEQQTMEKIPLKTQRAVLRIGLNRIKLLATFITVYAKLVETCTLWREAEGLISFPKERVWMLYEVNMNYLEKKPFSNKIVWLKLQNHIYFLFLIGVQLCLDLFRNLLYLVNQHLQSYWQMPCSPLMGLFACSSQNELLLSSREKWSNKQLQYFACQRWVI